MIDRNKRIIDPEQVTTMDSNKDTDSDDHLEKNNFSMRLSKKRKPDDNGITPKKKSKPQKDLYKQPTVEELNQLRETENLFHSNLFRLQIEEILNAVKIKNKYKKLFGTWFEKFKNHVEAIECTKDFDLNDDSLFENCDVKIPMKKLPNNCPGTLKFMPPWDIKIGGSYSLDTVVGPNVSVDVLVEMPDSLFQKVDSKNYRYTRKKAIYLAYIGSNINEELAESKCFVGNHSNPILKLVPNGKLSKRFTVYVHAVVQETSFLMNKFTPEKNNVRPGWFFNDETKQNDKNPSTPHYNSIVLHDLTALKTNAQNAKIIKEYPNIRDGIILLKIWLKQREFSNNFETFNGHIITMYVLYLLLKKKLNTFMSSYQIVRNTWYHLANSNWCKEGISLCEDEKMDERIAKYHKYYDCVFLDSTGFHNLAANMLENIFQWISGQAEQSIECLNNTRVNGFQVLFMRKVPFYKTFDNVICIHDVKALEDVVDLNSGDADKLNYGSNKYLQAIKFVLKILKQGLGNRVSFMTTLPRKIREWKMSDDIPNDFERLYIGLQLDQNLCMSIVDKGPGANLPEAKEFRNFWGKKCDLRRFKDGTICEAVVWSKENTPLTLKRAISQKITKYLFQQKLKLSEKIHYFFFSNQMEEFLKYKTIQITKFRYGVEEASLQAINTFSALEKELSNLSDLPLSINGVQGCSAIFRYTDVFPPLASIRRADDVSIVASKSHLLFVEKTTVKEVPLYLAPIEATIQLSMSGKWPEDLEALRMTKAAFNIQIAECMRKQCKSRVHADFDHIDIMKDGFVFRLRIAHQKEIGLVKQMKDIDGVVKYRDNEESMELEKKLFHLPRITGALYGLHCQQPSFGTACCLAKRWLSAQLIDDFHMPDIAVELLMASMYLSSDPYKPAHVPQVAFLRFLESFANEHWTTDPIVVNFNNEMSREEVVEVENLFGTSRDTLPPLFICTPYDRQSSIWTRKAPTPLILNRISALARASLELLESQLFSSTNISCDALFNPPLSGYDCLIKLKTSLNSRRCEAINIDDENLPMIDLHPFKEHSLAKIPIVGFDPVAEYLNELRSSYSDFALFFHDTFGGSIIGVVFKPQAQKEKDFKVTSANGHRFTNGKKLTLNVSALIEDFYILGKGLIQNINIQTKDINAI